MTINVGNLNPLNEDKFIEEFNALDEPAREERIRTLTKERNEVLDSNRKLFERAKEAEGFKKDDDGNWTKTVEKETKKSEAKGLVKSDEDLMKRLDTMALKMAGITADDEVELFNKWKERTGMGSDEITGDDIFQAKLADLRTAKANAAATADIKGEGSVSGAKSEPDYWIAKATKGEDGKLRFPEETPKELYSSIVSKLGAGEPGASKGKLEFYNTK